MSSLYILVHSVFSLQATHWFYTSKKKKRKSLIIFFFSSFHCCWKMVREPERQTERENDSCFYSGAVWAVWDDIHVVSDKIGKRGFYSMFSTPAMACLNSMVNGASFLFALLCKYLSFSLYFMFFHYILCFFVLVCFSHIFLAKEIIDVNGT